MTLGQIAYMARNANFHLYQLEPRSGVYISTQGFHQHIMGELWRIEIQRQAAERNAAQEFAQAIEVEAKEDVTAN